jgi:hypothetical protein
MADIGDFTKQGSMFLKAEDVLNSPDKQFVINDEAHLVDNEKFGGQRLHILGTFNGESKTFNCSRTNARTISEVLGEDTKQWLGAILTLETYRTKVSDGRMVDAINVKEVKPLKGAPQAGPKVTDLGAQ